jgi:hypothetical protein
VENPPLRIRQSDSEKQAGRPEWKRIGLELKAWDCRQGELEVGHWRTIGGEKELCLPTKIDH